MFFVIKQKTAYEMRISDWSSDVCSSDLRECRGQQSERRRLIDIDDRRDVVAQISADHVAGRVDPDRQGAIDLTQQPPVAEKNGMIGDGETGQAPWRERVRPYV